MKTAYLTYLLAAIGFSLSAPFAQAVGTIGDLNDTGQTLCYDGTNMVTCTAANTGDDAPYPRQDGRYGRDAQAVAGKLNKIGSGNVGFDFTKIANNGTELPASATQGTNPTDWACTRDNVTGLMWDARSASNDPTYTWYDAADLATSVNSTGLCGFKDWRLPDIHELYGITHAGKVNPAIDPSFFPNTKSAWYWTNTTDAPDPAGAWVVSFNYGYDYNDGKSSSYAVRLVRFGQWLDPFHDNLDGTITHIPSGAIWAKCSVGQTYSNGTCTGAASYMTWQQALKAAKDSRFLGFSDWRLPNKQELMSLVDFSTYSPAINSTYFPSTLSTFYWTSTTVTDYPASAWVVYFYDGNLNYSDKSLNYAVRLVRFGQCFDPLTGACDSSLTLTVSKVGTGSGTVTSSPAGINCGNTCSSLFNNSTDVILNASANLNSLFTGWSGDCSGTSSSCTVKMSAAKNVIANFAATAYTLIVTKGGTGTGTVTSDPAGINCGTVCNQDYSINTIVTLTAAETIGLKFTGWSGECEGNGTTCVIIMDGAKSTIATFTSKTNQTIGAISFNPTTLSVGGTTTVSATASSGLPVSFSSLTPSICSVTGNTVNGVAIGSCALAANQAGNDTYNAAPQVTKGISVIAATKANQTIGAISFNPSTLTVGGTTTVSATASSGLPVTFSSTTASICTVNGTMVSGVAAGTCAIAANQAGNASYNAAPQVTQSITVGKANQTIGAISFNPNILSAGGTTTVSASASSGLPVTFSSTTASVCTVNGTTVSGVAAGICTIAADQAGNTNYNAASQVTQSLTVGKANQTIGTIIFNPNILSAGGTTTVSATASSGLPVTFSSTTASVCIVNGTTVSGVAAGTCAIAANQAGNDSYNAAPQVTQSISVNAATKTNQTIGTISFNPNILSAGGTTTVSASASSGLPVTFSSTTASVCTVNGTTVSGVAAGTCAIAANQAGNASYNAAPQVTQSISVNAATKTNQTIGTISFNPNILSAGGTTTVSASASSGLPVTFSAITPTVCGVNGNTVSGITAGVCTVAANQAGNASYNAAPQVTQSIAVNAATKKNQTIGTITFDPNLLAVAGTTTVSATASSGLPVIFSAITPTCGVTGNTVTGVTAGVCLVAANQAGNETYNPAPQITQSIIVTAPDKLDQTLSQITFNPNTLSIGGTTTVSASATSGLPVTFSVLTPAVCTLNNTLVSGVTTGTCTLTANQFGNDDYNAAPPVTNAIIVTAGVPEAPRIGNATAGNAQATVTFLPPANNGGSPILSYTVIANPGGFSATKAASPIAVTGLTNGTSYTFTVKATNSAGPGGVRPSNPVKPTASTDPGVWAMSGPMASPHHRHTAIPLPNGKTLVAGGSTSDGFSAEIYNPASGTWSSAAAMLHAHTDYYTAILLKNGPIQTNGNVLVIGGYGTNGILNSAELYDPNTNIWKSTGSMFKKRNGHTATLLSNGKVLVSGGDDGEGGFSAELYDPSTGKWALTGAMGQIRKLHKAILLSNGKILVTGGSDEGNTSLANAEIYDPATGLWRPTGSMLATRDGHTATVLPNGTVMVVGGKSYDGTAQISYDTAEIYNPVTEKWTATGSMSTVRDNHTAIPLPNGKIFITGGEYVGNNSTGALSSAEIYDPASGTWSNTDSMTQWRYTHTATLLSNGKVFVAGGCNVNDSTGSSCLAVLSSSEVYTSNNASFLMTVTKAGNGTVTSSPSGINCGTDCNESYANGTLVTLTATPESGYTLSGWSGDCTGTSQTCKVTMSAAKTINATFTAKSKINQSIGAITFNPSTLTVGKTTKASATATSKLAVTFNATTPTVCTVSGTNGETLTGLMAGTCTVTADQAGNDTYNAAPQVSKTIAVTKTSQTIGSISFNPATLSVNGTSTVSATASSGLPVTFSATTASTCKVSGNTVTGLTAGTCTVSANQAGNDTYAVASQVTKSITVAKSTQTISALTFNPATLSVNGTTTVSGTASSGLAVIYSTTTGTVCKVSGNTVTGLTAGTCTVSANQSGNANYISAATVTQKITVNKGTQTIGPVSLNPVTLKVGKTSTLSASATSGLGVKFSTLTPSNCTTSGTNGVILKGLAIGTCTVTANQSGNANYNAAPQVSQDIAIAN